MLAFRFSSFSQSVFRILLILDAGRTVWISRAILGQLGLKLRWSPLIKVFTGYENDGPLHYVAYEQWVVLFLFSSLVLTICTLGYHILQISSTILTTLMYQELLITSNGWIYWICVQSILVYDNDRPRGNNIEFFFLMSIFNVDFQCRIFQCLFLMLIFDVDFQCCCLTIIIIFNVFFFFSFFGFFFSKYFSALIIFLYFSLFFTF